MIVCRILLAFARDTQSPLLLPIAKLFCGITGKPTNATYFIDEALEGVLIALVRTSRTDVQLSATRAIAPSPAMRG
jgi:hypothetical protein